MVDYSWKTLIIYMIGRISLAFYQHPFLFTIHWVLSASHIFLLVQGLQLKTFLILFSHNIVRKSIVLLSGKCRKTNGSIINDIKQDIYCKFRNYCDLTFWNMITVVECNFFWYFYGNKLSCILNRNFKIAIINELLQTLNI